MDSLDVVELVMDVEGAFALDLTDVEAEHLGRAGTLADLWRLIVRATGRGEPGPGTGPPPGDPTWARLRVVVARRLGVPPDDVRPDWPLAP